MAMSRNKYNLICWLQDWYEHNCNGDWEHQYGISINTVDNPGWIINIDLSGTNLEGYMLELTKIHNSENDWIQYWTEGDCFKAAGGPGNLSEILQVFHDWAESKNS